MMAAAAALVAIISLATQAGPSLVSYAINHGLTGPSKQNPTAHYDFGVVVAMSVLYLVSIVVSASAQWGQARVTGRLASWVMNDLRIKVFRHLQRLSLDFFTEEKAGRRHEPHDERHREPAAAPAGRAGAVRHPGPDDGRDHGLAVRDERGAGGDHRAGRPALPDRDVDLVPPGVRAWLRQGARRHRPRAGRPLREPPGRARRHGAQPPALQHRDAPRRRRLVPRRQQLHGPDRQHLRARVTGAQRVRPGAHPRFRRVHVPAPRDQPRRAHRVLPVREPVLRADPAA